MARIGFSGPTYQSSSVNADCQRCMNRFPEVNESGQGNSAMILLPSPGLSIFATLPEKPVRGEFEFNKRFFAVGGTKFCEIIASGGVNPVGSVVNDGLPVSMAANQAGQLLIASGGTLYVFNLNTGILTQVANAPTGISVVAFSDGFFVALSKTSNQFQLSNSLDGLTWSGINVAKISVFPENLVTMIADHRELAFLGSKESVIYYDSGNTFPYDVVPGGFIEQGAAAVYGITRADNSVFWLGRDERGHGIFWRNNGYTPQRVSNHSVEQIWSRYPRISDAVVYSFQDQGHTFIHVYFPSGLNDTGLPLGASWRYDCATQMWHEVGFWDSQAARYTAHRSQCHAFAFGMHLVGDWNSGNIYQMSSPVANGGTWAFCDDFGNPMRRMRRSPHVSTEKQRIFHSQLQLDVETGVGPQPPLIGPDLGPPRAPSSIILQDADGILWQVTIDDSGNIDTVAIPSGVAQTIILADSGMIPSTAWQFGITIAGNLTTTPFAFSGGGYGEGGEGEGGYGSGFSGFPPGFQQIYPLMSTPGNHLTGFLVTIDGNIQTNAPNQARDPQVCLRWSDDGGHTWSNEHWKGIGQAGKFKTRVIWRRLGWAWDRVYEVSDSDPVPIRIIDAYLEASPGFQPTERLVHQLRKGA